MQHFLDLLPTINDSNFADIALSVFRFQYKNNVLYRTYSQAVRKVPEAVNSVHDIPFLPIRFFKTHHVISGSWKPETEFTSSATTGAMVSKHSIENLSFYKKNATAIFTGYYGAVSDYHFLALLPSYLERSGSSLIAMIDHFIKTDTGHSGFYLNDDEELLLKIDSLRASHKRTMLWGVSFALLDLAEKHKIDLSHCIVMETGGMKGRRKEWVREELHQFLCERFKVKQIHSEYGMTELLSQAYSTGWGYFRCPPRMKVLLRDINDPFSMAGQGKVGAINVIDLANVHSCAFIETEDLGRLKDESFEVLGRMDNSDVRGCNLLIG
ncbi:MAG: acyl transferase [Bacteroidetes bacterium]|nr:acyl transferase [Bacteroidota bacterium]